MNFNCAITLVMGLVMVVVALLVMMFSIGYGVLYNGVHCDCHVDGHGIGQTLATEFLLHVTSIVAWVHPPYCAKFVLCEFYW